MECLRRRDIRREGLPNISVMILFSRTSEKATARMLALIPWPRKGKDALGLRRCNASAKD